jgi:hypothetical protein
MYAGAKYASAYIDNFESMSQALTQVRLIQRLWAQGFYLTEAFLLHFKSKKTAKIAIKLNP